MLLKKIQFGNENHEGVKLNSRSVLLTRTYTLDRTDCLSVGADKVDNIIGDELLLNFGAKFHNFEFLVF